jgi:anti-anti-sigma factor
MVTVASNGNGRHGRSAWVSRHGRTAAISLRGELDLADAPTLHAASAEALAQRPTELLLVDMTAVSFFDSAIAHWLTDAHRHASATGTRLVALVADRQACDLLELLGITGELTVVNGR